MWGRKYLVGRAVVGDVWEEFTPFLRCDAETGHIVCTTNAVGSVNARIRRAVKAHGHFTPERLRPDVCLHGDHVPRSHWPGSDPLEQPLEDRAERLRPHLRRPPVGGPPVTSTSPATPAVSDRSVGGVTKGDATGGGCGGGGERIGEFGHLGAGCGEFLAGALRLSSRGAVARGTPQCHGRSRRGCVRSVGPRRRGGSGGGRTPAGQGPCPADRGRTATARGWSARALRPNGRVDGGPAAAVRAHRQGPDAEVEPQLPPVADLHGLGAGPGRSPCHKSRNHPGTRSEPTWRPGRTSIRVGAGGCGFVVAFLWGGGSVGVVAGVVALGFGSVAAAVHGAPASGAVLGHVVEVQNALGVAAGADACGAVGEQS